jgi:hypothetical protein
MVRVPRAVGDICLHPVDTVKTVQQSVSETAGGKSSTTLVGAISKIFKAGGLFGFYAGAAPYVTLDALSGCIKFATYEACNRCQLVALCMGRLRASAQRWDMLVVFQCPGCRVAG